jgi:methionyl-tRNA formyltransferase
LERLLAGPHEIVAVATRADRPSGRGQKIAISPVKALALDKDIEVLQPVSAKDPEFAERLREISPDLGVVVAYCRLLPNDVIDTPRLGCINAHASLLPRLRGAAPIERSILEGYDETGVTIMRISERMDAGDMMISRSVPIDTQTDAGSLRDRLAEVSADLLADAVDLLARGEARFTPQDDSAATYAPPLEKSEAEIDWNADAETIDRAIRAFRPRPGAFTFHDGLRLKIIEGRPAAGATGDPPGTIRVETGGAVVCCGNGAIRILTIQPEGKRPMPATDYLRGQGAGKQPVLGRATDA